MDAPVGKGDAGTQDQSPDDAGDQDLACGSQRGNPGANVNCEACDRIVPVLHLRSIPADAEHFLGARSDGVSHLGVGTVMGQPTA